MQNYSSWRWQRIMKEVLIMNIRMKKTMEAESSVQYMQYVGKHIIRHYDEIRYDVLKRLHELKSCEELTEDEVIEAKTKELYLVNLNNELNAVVDAFVNIRLFELEDIIAFIDGVRGELGIAENGKYLKGDK